MNYHSDDNHFAMGAQLVADGYTPYVHFPYFQMPYAAYIFGFMLKIDLSIYKYLTLRLTNLAFCLAALVAVYFICLRAAKSKLIALGGVLLLSTSEFWNLSAEQLNSYAIANLFAILAFGSLITVKQPASIRIFLSSIFVGAAVASKLYYVFLVPPILLFAVALSKSASHRAVLNTCALWFAGLAIALVPVGLVAAIDPAAFVFDNYKYHILNSKYREFSQSGDGMTFPAKLKFLFQMLGKPAYLSTVFLALVMLPYVGRNFSARQTEHQALLAAAGSFAFMLIAAMVPRPLWPSYFLAPLPFAVIALANIYGMSGKIEESSKQRLDFIFISIATFVSALSLPTSLYHIKKAIDVNSWSTVTIHRDGNRIHDLLAEQGHSGKLLTFEGIYAIEGGLPFYRQIAGTTFAYRVGDFLNDNLWARSHITSRANLASLLDASPPAAILVSSRFDKFNDETLKYVKENRYKEFDIKSSDHRLFVHNVTN